MFFRKLFPFHKPIEEAEHPTDKLTFMVKREVKTLLDSGRSFLDEKKYQEAIKVYKKAVDVDPSCALTHFNLGYVFHESGQMDSARESYEKAVELNPTCSLFLEHYARLQFEMQDYKEATRLFYRASLVGKIQPVSLGLWGRALFEQGLYEQSIETFERLLEQKQQPAVQNGAKYWLAVARIKLGHLAPARRIAYDLLSRKNVDNKVLFDLGEQFVEARCLSMAREIFEKIAIEKEEFLLTRLRLEDIRGLEKQIDDMLPALFEGDEERMLHQIHALGEFGSEKISRALISLIHSPSAPLREGILRYQGKYGFDVSQQVVPLLTDAVSFVREAAYDYFEKLFRGDHLTEIAKGLKDPVANIRRHAARILGRFGTIESLPQLEIALDDPGSKTCTIEIRQAIGTIKHRYQRKMDELYREQPSLNYQIGTQNRTTDWRFWVIVGLQLLAVSYFLYFILTRF